MQTNRSGDVFKEEEQGIHPKGAKKKAVAGGSRLKEVSPSLVSHLMNRDQRRGQKENGTLRGTGASP